MSKEAKIRLSKLNAGKTHPISEDTKRKISLSRMNHVVANTTKIRISNTLKDYYQSKEGIQKRRYLSNLATGRINKTKGTV